MVLLKAFSDRARDFDDLAVIYTHKGSSLDNDYIDEWAKLLDESIGTHEVSERLEQARAKAGVERRK